MCVCVCVQMCVCACACKCGRACMRAHTQRGMHARAHAHTFSHHAVRRRASRRMVAVLRAGWWAAQGTCTICLQPNISGRAADPRARACARGDLPCTWENTGAPAAGAAAPLNMPSGGMLFATSLPGSSMSPMRLVHARCAVCIHRGLPHAPSGGGPGLGPGRTRPGQAKLQLCSPNC